MWFIHLYAEPLPSIDSYLTGLVLMTGEYADSQTHLLPSVPDIGQHTVEVSEVLGFKQLKFK